MVKAVFDEMLKPAPKNHFTVGIIDDVTHTSLDVDPTSLAKTPQELCAPYSMVSGLTAQSPRQELHQDHWRRY